MSQNEIVMQDKSDYLDREESKTGIKVLDTYKNLEHLLNHLKDPKSNIPLIRHNQMSRQIEIEIKSLGIDRNTNLESVFTIIDRIAKINKYPSTVNIPTHLLHISRINEYHPIVDMIKENPWDGFNRLDAFIKTIKVNGNTEIASKLIKTWMVSAIAAAHSEHGHTNQGVLVLQGKQNIGKTRFVEQLDPINCGAVRSGFLLDPSSKDSILAGSQHWILELGELDATFRKSDIARLKAYITLGVDKVRPPYGRVEINYPRRSAYIATVNEENFLSDETGNRRWWTVPVESIDLKHSLDLIQVWSEVYQLWIDGYKHYLDDETIIQLNEHNSEFEKIDPMEEMLASRYNWESTARHQISATEVLLELGYNKPTKSEQTRIGSLIKKFTKKPATRLPGGKIRVHEMPYLPY